jgi:hypothetical protein
MFKRNEFRLSFSPLEIPRKTPGDLLRESLERREAAQQALMTPPRMAGDIVPGSVQDRTNHLQELQNARIERAAMLGVHTPAGLGSIATARTLCPRCSGCDCRSRGSF